MNEEPSASVCCSCDAVRMAVEKDGVSADGDGLDASKVGLRGPGVRGRAGTG
ncbi:hypothetical protein ACFVFQ_30790 [Streptomyces sp. NPDC057743]|uniref:hypothetical protein n=1 Tax=Streptomyces sp. NPDC057743 TaxID=3346236 RepID=UPI0036C1A061